MLRSDSYYNVTSKLDIYPLERDGAVLEYDGMELQKVDRPTVECADYLRARCPHPGPLPQGEGANTKNSYGSLLSSGFLLR